MRICRILANLALLSITLAFASSASSQVEQEMNADEAEQESSAGDIPDTDEAKGLEAPQNLDDIDLGKNLSSVSPLQRKLPVPTTCGNNICDSKESYISCSKDCKNRVGVFYSGWHAPAYRSFEIAKNKNLPFFTIEKILQNRLEVDNKMLSFKQVWQTSEIEHSAANFVYQYEPQDGFYCIVKERTPGQLNYDASHEGNYGPGRELPDCHMAEAILTKQAKQMIDAGIDYVVVDGTNIADNNAFSDAIQLRPFEVMLEVWSKLRAKGIPTPEVAMWQRLPTRPAKSADDKDWLFKKVLDVYNAAEFSNVIMRDHRSGKKVFYYPDLGDFNSSFVSLVNDNEGRKNILAVPMWAYGKTPMQWSFLSACDTAGRIDDTPCNQPVTTMSVLGSQIAVSPSYQVSYVSLPFMGPGVMGGLTLRKMFETAFRTRPDYVMLTGWNEQIAQPQKVEGVSMGFETDQSMKNQAFVDIFGVEYSRDLEPSKEYGSKLYDLMSSCLRVYRSQAKSCSNKAEACCQGGNFSDSYARIKGPNGEFVLYSKTTKRALNMKSLYACKAGESDDFYSLDDDCEGLGNAQKVGYVSTSKGRDTLRTLRRCYGNGRHAYSLLANCPSGTKFEGILGYVR